jgi:hypothetical protein
MPVRTRQHAGFLCFIDMDKRESRYNTQDSRSHATMVAGPEKQTYPLSPNSRKRLSTPSRPLQSNMPSLFQPSLETSSTSTMSVFSTAERGMLIAGQATRFRRTWTVTSSDSGFKTPRERNHSRHRCKRFGTRSTGQMPRRDERKHGMLRPSLPSP